MRRFLNLLRRLCGRSRIGSSGAKTTTKQQAITSRQHPRTRARRVRVRAVPDTSWDDVGIESPNSIDPSVRLVVSLFETLDFEQLFRRTGIRIGPDGMLAKRRIGAQGRLENQRLPLFVELGPEDRSATLSALMSPAQPDGSPWYVPRAYLNELSVNPNLTWVTGQSRIGWGRRLERHGKGLRYLIAEQAGGNRQQAGHQSDQCSKPAAAVSRRLVTRHRPAR